MLRSGNMEEDFDNQNEDEGSSSNNSYRPNSYNNGNRNGYQNNGGGGYNKGYQNNGGGGGYNKGYQNNGGGGYNKGGFSKPGFKKNTYLDSDVAQIYKAYAGTGNVGAPPDILTQIKKLTRELDVHGYTTRTGGMEGCEEAFETSAQKLELHLPWKNFNNKQSEFAFTSKQALAIAKLYHPTFDGLSFSIQAIIAKNIKILLGKDLKSAARFLLCWSEDGVETIALRTAKTGNVGHAIAAANSLKIPVFNLGKPDAEKRLREFLELPAAKVETNNEF